MNPYLIYNGQGGGGDEAATPPYHSRKMGVVGGTTWVTLVIYIVLSDG